MQHVASDLLSDEKKQQVPVLDLGACVGRVHRAAKCPVTKYGWNFSFVSCIDQRS